MHLFFLGFAIPCRGWARVWLGFCLWFVTSFTRLGSSCMFAENMEAEQLMKVWFQSLKVPMKRKFFRHTFKINSKILGAHDKNCWFYERAKLSYFTFKNGQEPGIEFIVLWRQFVCSGLFTPCHRGEIQRKRKYQVILNRILSPIYREFLMKILWRQIRKMLKNL